MFDRRWFLGDLDPDPDPLDLLDLPADELSERLAVLHDLRHPLRPIASGE